jgi:hypothetical protein
VVGIHLPIPFQQLFTGTGSLAFSASRDALERKNGQVCIRAALPSESRRAKVS